MSHEKTYVICENMCMEEGLTKNEIDNTYAKKTTVEALASGSPKGTYTDSAALKAANPDTGVYIATGNGHIYSWTKDSTSNPVDLGVYQATGIENNAIKYSNLSKLLQDYTPINNVLTKFYDSLGLLWEIQAYAGASYELVDKPENMNCVSDKVIKVTMPTQNSHVRIIPKFIDKFNYGRNICFSVYLYGESDSRIYVYKGSTGLGNKRYMNGVNEFVPLEFTVTDVQPNSNINLRVINSSATQKIVYISDFTCIYSDTPNDSFINYNERYYEKTSIMTTESNQIGVGFGDSIMQGFGVLTQDVIPTKDCISVMSKVLNATIYNGGVGGTRLTSGNCSFVEIVNSLINNDWTNFDSHLNTLIASTPKMNSAITQYNKIKALDFSKVDFLVIAYGTNDWTANKTLENANNSMDTNTVNGALRYCISQLLSEYPNLRIYVFTPCYRDNLGDNHETSDTYINPVTNLTLIQVGDSIFNTCQELHIPCKNMYKVSNLNQYNRDHYMSDYVHRNEAGYKLLGAQYAKFIMSN